MTLVITEHDVTEYLRTVQYYEDWVNPDEFPIYSS